MFAILFKSKKKLVNKIENPTVNWDLIKEYVVNYYGVKKDIVEFYYRTNEFGITRRIVFGPPKTSMVFLDNGICKVSNKVYLEKKTKEK